MFRRKVRTASTENNAQFNPRLYVALDTETTGVDVWGDSQAFAVSMCDDNGNTWYCQWPVCPFTREVTPNPKDVAFIRNIVSKPGIQVIMHNSKFDCRMMEKVGIHLSALCAGKIHDTLFMARVCFTLEVDYGLKFLSRTRLDIPDQDEKDLKEAVISARRKLKMYNLKAANYGERLMIAKKEPKEDYWLPTYFDPDFKGCEQYARTDAYRTLALFLFYKDIMSIDKYLLDKYLQEMNEVWPIVNAMEKRGMKVYPKAVEVEAAICRSDMDKHLTAMLQIIEDEKLMPFPYEKTIPPPARRSKVEWKGPEFNPGSPQQLMRVLYLPREEGGLALQTDRRSRTTGRMTTDKDTLRELMYSPFVRELVGYRAAAHTLSLFFTKFDVLMKPDPLEKGGYCLHPGINQCGTKTGRFSMSDPNLQQQTSGGKKSLSASYSSTKVFGPRKGYVWLNYDYSQQEVRIFAELSQCKIMIDAINNKVDPYEAMANKAWGGKGNPNSLKACIQALELGRTSLPENEKVRDAWKEFGWTLGQRIDSQNCRSICDQWLASFDYDIVAAELSLGKTASRQRCKHITFAKIYGGGPGSYTHLLYCTLEEARTFGLEYDASMPEIKLFMKSVEKQGRSNGFIINLYNRKLRVDPSFAYRGTNYMVQGSAADMMKQSLIKVHQFLQETIVDAHLIVTIHDELKIEIRESHISKGFMRSIAYRMQDTEGRIKLPMEVECTITRGRWGDANEEKVNLWN